MGAGRAEQAVPAEEKMRGCAIGELYPGSEPGATKPYLLQQGRPVDVVEGIFEVYLEDALVAGVDGIVVEDGGNGMNDGLTSTLDADAELKRGEEGATLFKSLCGKAFRDPMPQSLTHRNGSMAISLFVSSKKVCATEERSDRGRDIALGEDVEGVRKGIESVDSPS